jgi:hypothetical protein
MVLPIDTDKIRRSFGDSRERFDEVSKGAPGVWFCPYSADRIPKLLRDQYSIRYLSFVVWQSRSGW